MRKLVGTSGWSPAGWKPIWSDWIRSKHGHRHYGNECLGVANGPKYDYPVKTSLAPLRLPAFGVWIKRRNKAKGPAGQRTKSKKLTNTPWEGVDLESLSLMKPFTRIRLWVRSMNYSPGFYLFILQKEEPFIRKSRARGRLHGEQVANIIRMKEFHFLREQTVRPLRAPTSHPPFEGWEPRPVLVDFADEEAIDSLHISTMAIAHVNRGKQLLVPDGPGNNRSVGHCTGASKESMEEIPSTPKKKQGCRNGTFPEDCEKFACLRDLVFYGGFCSHNMRKSSLEVWMGAEKWSRKW